METLEEEHERFAARGRARLKEGGGRCAEILRDPCLDLARPASQLRQYAVQTLLFELDNASSSAGDVTGLANGLTGVVPAGVPRPRLVCRSIDP